MKRNEGFTLIELLVTISAGALVTFAAVSLLLLGARVQYQTTHEAQEQQTVRIVMSLLEDMAGSGAFNEIVPLENNSWQLWECTNDPGTEHAHSTDKPIFTYNAATGSIYRGAADTGNAPLLTGLNNAGVVMEGKDKNVLRLSFETERGGNYVTRVYCRQGIKDLTAEEIVDNKVNNYLEGKKDAEEHKDTVAAKRFKFLDTLAGEYQNGGNTGEIQNPIDDELYAYYSHWYIEDGWGKNGWNKDTPWCACFVSWAAVNMPGSTITKGSPFVFANVDAGMAAFKTASNGGKWTGAVPGVVPTPGDYIFFDWSGEKKDPAHVGVVLDTQGGYVYTIEGNSSGRVAVRKYEIGDDVIMGYGILPEFEA